MFPNSLPRLCLLTWVRQNLHHLFCSVSLDRSSFSYPFVPRGQFWVRTDSGHWGVEGIWDGCQCRHRHSRKRGRKSTHNTQQEHDHLKNSTGAWKRRCVRDSSASVVGWSPVYTCKTRQLRKKSFVVFQPCNYQRSSNRENMDISE